MTLAHRPVGNPRTTGKEQFYTPPAVATAVVARMLGQWPTALERIWLEPAGGTGAFVDAARAAGVCDIVSVDIEPQHRDVAVGDFLTQRFDLSGAVAVGNPPFGRNNALSIPFFNKAAQYSDLIAFVVPRSWRKWSVLNRLDRSFHLVEDTDLTVNYVDVQGRDAYAKNTLQTCVQLWERRSELRALLSVADRGLVKRCTAHEADVSLTVFGYGCGTVLTEFSREKVTTQMYLRLGHPQALEALQSVDYTRFSHNVAYTQALSFAEINFLLNDYVLGDPMLVASAT